MQVDVTQSGVTSILGSLEAALSTEETSLIIFFREKLLINLTNEVFYENIIFSLY